MPTYKITVERTIETTTTKDFEIVAEDEKNARELALEEAELDDEDWGEDHSCPDVEFYITVTEKIADVLPDTQLETPEMLEAAGQQRLI